MVDHSPCDELGYQDKIPFSTQGFWRILPPTVAGHCLLLVCNGRVFIWHHSLSKQSHRCCVSTTVNDPLCFMQGKNQPTTAFARDQGSDEEEATSQLFRRLSLNLMRGNALMLSSRHQDEELKTSLCQKLTEWKN